MAASTAPSINESLQRSPEEGSSSSSTTPSNALEPERQLVAEVVSTCDVMAVPASGPAATMLPGHVLEHILGMLDCVSLSHAACTCRAWRAAADSDGLWAAQLSHNFGMSYCWGSQSGIWLPPPRSLPRAGNSARRGFGSWPRAVSQALAEDQPKGSEDELDDGAGADPAADALFIGRPQLAFQQFMAAPICAHLAHLAQHAHALDAIHAGGGWRMRVALHAGTAPPGTGAKPPSPQRTCSGDRDSGSAHTAATHTTTAAQWMPPPTPVTAAAASALAKPWNGTAAADSAAAAAPLRSALLPCIDAVHNPQSSWLRFRLPRWVSDATGRAHKNTWLELQLLAMTPAEGAASSAGSALQVAADGAAAAVEAAAAVPEGARVIIDSCPFVLPTGDRQRLLQSHVEGLYVWDDGDEGEGEPAAGAGAAAAAGATGSADEACGPHVVAYVHYEQLLPRCAPVPAPFNQAGLKLRYPLSSLQPGRANKDRRATASGNGPAAYLYLDWCKLPSPSTAAQTPAQQQQHDGAAAGAGTDGAQGAAAAARGGGLQGSCLVRLWRKAGLSGGGEAGNLTRGSVEPQDAPLVVLRGSALNGDVVFLDVPSAAQQPGEQKQESADENGNGSAVVGAAAGEQPAHADDGNGGAGAGASMRVGVATGSHQAWAHAWLDAIGWQPGRFCCAPAERRPRALPTQQPQQPQPRAESPHQPAAQQQQQEQPSARGAGRWSVPGEGFWQLPPAQQLSKLFGNPCRTTSCVGAPSTASVASMGVASMGVVSGVKPSGASSNGGEQQSLRTASSGGSATSSVAAAAAMESAAALVAAQLTHLCSGDVMADFALFDATGALLVGRSGVELWMDSDAPMASLHFLIDQISPERQTLWQNRLLMRYPAAGSAGGGSAQQQAAVERAAGVALHLPADHWAALQAAAVAVDVGTASASGGDADAAASGGRACAAAWV